MTDVNQLITEHLDIWTSATEKKSGAGRGNGGAISLYGIKKLRELILELAVRGKLVPQNEGDEPASVLLDRLKDQQATMHAQGRVKKPKPVAKIEVSETPFELPPGWIWCRVSQLGHDWGQKVPDTTFTYIDVGSINKELGLVSEPTVLSASAAPSRARRLIKKGTVIYATVRPYLLNIAVVTEEFEPEPIASTAFAVVHPFEGVSPSYLYRYLRSPTFISYVEGCQSGIAYPAINDKQFFSGLVPLPPTAEQHRIVAKVDELMGLCDTLEAQAEDSLKAHQTLVETCLATLTNTPENLAQNWARIETHIDILFATEESIERLRQTIYLLATQGKLVAQDTTEASAEQLLLEVYERRQALLEAGYPNEKEAKTQIKKSEKQIVPDGLPELPPGWEWATLMQSSLMVIDCKNKTAPYSEDGVRLIRTTNVRNGRLNETDQKYVDEKTFEAWSLRAKPEPGDLLITREAPMGEACLIPDGERLCLGQRMMLARLVPDTINKDYLLITFLSPDLMERVQDKPLGMTVEHLRVGGVETLMVPVPPKAEQARIVERVHRLIAICEQLKTKVKIAQKLQTALSDTLVEKAA